MPNSPRIIEKPWGREVIFADCELYLGKVIEIDSGARLSLQYHRHKDETIYVDSGRVATRLANIPGEEGKQVILNPGDCLRLTPGTIHRFAALGGPARILEVSTPHPDDTVRLQDDFGRD